VWIVRPHLAGRCQIRLDQLKLGERRTEILDDLRRDLVGLRQV
jgi:hypothetical protein